MPVGLDYVAGKMSGTYNLSYAPILVNFLRISLRTPGI